MPTIDVYKDEPTWLQGRRNGMGSSDAPVAVGEGYHSPLEWWMRKTGKIDEQPDSRRFRFGHAAERFVAQEVEQELDLGLEDPGEYTVFRHSEVDLGWLTATVDRLVMRSKPGKKQIHGNYGAVNDALVRLRENDEIAGPLEIKTVSQNARHKWKDDNDDDQPAPYAWVQLQHTLDVLAMPKGWIAALVGAGEDLLIFEVERDDEFIGELREAEGSLWDYVTQDVVPPVDGLPGTAKALERLYPKQEPGRVIELDPATFGPLVETREELIEAAKNIRKELDSIDNAIKGEMALAERAEVPGYCAFTWKQTSYVKPPQEEKLIEYRSLRKVKL